MAISEDSIRNLIEDYEGYREECLDARSSIDTARAGLYSAVINDLKKLLPRETLADVAGDDLSTFVGTWVEYAGQKALVLMTEPERLLVMIPKRNELCWRLSSVVYPLSTPRVWDEDGELAY